MVTAIVSPSARASARKTEPMIPVRAYGTMTFHVDSHFVAPNASAASRCSVGTANRIPREMEMIKGTTMMARISPAAKKPIPKAGPWKKGRKPSVAFRNGSTTFRKIGTRTNIPSSPMITLGTAASSSIEKVNASEIPCGASSARKIAAPTPMGTAIRRPRAEVTTVP